MDDLEDKASVGERVVVCGCCCCCGCAELESCDGVVEVAAEIGAPFDVETDEARRGGGRERGEPGGGDGRVGGDGGGDEVGGVEEDVEEVVVWVWCCIGDCDGCGRCHLLLLCGWVWRRENLGEKKRGKKKEEVFEIGRAHV